MLIGRTGRTALIILLPVGVMLAGSRQAPAVLLTPGDLLVADPNAFGGTGGVIKVDPVTGVQTVVSRNGTGFGASFVDPLNPAPARQRPGSDRRETLASTGRAALVPLGRGTL